MKTMIVVLLIMAAACAAFANSATASPVSQANAVRAAHEYLQSEAFSYKSLFQQLRYEGYAAGDASYAARHSGANWYKQAATKARSYLQSEAFSHIGLMQQLEFEGFTAAQAAYGVRAVGL
jgi:hypothetical protein